MKHVDITVSFVNALVEHGRSKWAYEGLDQYRITLQPGKEVVGLLECPAGAVHVWHRYGHHIANLVSDRLYFGRVGR